MTDEQFDVIAALIRSKETATQVAVRLVMVDGQSVPIAAKAVGVDRALVYQGVRRFKSAHAKIVSVPWDQFKAS